MKFTIIVALLIFTFVNTHPMHREVMDIISTKPIKDQFKMWHYVMQKPYELNSEVALQKYKIFKKNVKLIEETNAKKLSYTVGLGPFTDLSYEEYRESFIDLKMAERAKEEEMKASKNISFDELADSEDEDFSEKIVTLKDINDYTDSKDWSYLWNYVKDQSSPYSCGSCWTFGTMGIIEAFDHMNAESVSDYLRLSEQQLIDCNTEPPQKGCKGGWYRSAFDYLKTNGAISEEEYPYVAYNSYCKYSKKKVAVKISGVDFCTSNGYAGWKCKDNDVLEAIKKGPYATSIFADNPVFMHYTGGIWNDAVCETFDHAVIIVEINLSKNYFKFRNSWNQYWGENGYGRISLSIANGPDMNWCGARDHMYQPKNVKRVN